MTSKFSLMLDTLVIGTLVYSNKTWTFSYSDEFKKQDETLPLVNFPKKDKIYESDKLFPFFESRIPGNAQLKKEDSKEDVVYLLREYGKRVITNPYVLLIN